MALRSDPEMGINSWLEDELYQQYLHDHGAVDDSWKHVFEQGAGNGRQTDEVQLQTAETTGEVKSQPVYEVAPGEQLTPLRGVAARIAENMNASVSIPVATSQRTIPVKVVDENRRIINQHRTLTGKGKVSFTHLIGWAIVKALKK